MAKGDRIYVSFWVDNVPVTHHAIDCGDSVIEYQGYNQGGKVTRIPKHSFGKRRTIKIKEYGKCDLPDVVVKRSESKLGQAGYCLFTNNCEHFAYWCKTGKKKSEQVNNAAASIIGGAVKAAAGVGANVATNTAAKAAGQAAIKSASPVAKTLMKVGLKQAPQVAKVAGRTAAGIAGVGGIVTGFAADAVVGQLLKEDEHLPKYDNDARKTGRIAGQVGSVVGGLGGTAAAAVLGGGAAIGVAVAAPAVLGIGVGLGSYHIFKKKKK